MDAKEPNTSPHLKYVSLGGGSKGHRGALRRSIQRGDLENVKEIRCKKSPSSYARGPTYRYSLSHKHAAVATLNHTITTSTIPN